jgi:hypothetical protein
MPTPVEQNVPYPYSQEICYGVLKDDVLPAFSVTLKMGYLGLRVQSGSIRLAVIEDDWRAYKLITKMRSVSFVTSALAMNWGPPIGMYCRSTGPDTTIVELVADSASFCDGQFINFALDMVYKQIPVYSWFVQRIVPNCYFDDVLIIDTAKLAEVSFRNELGRAGLRHVFQNIHQLLNRCLKNRATTF